MEIAVVVLTVLAVVALVVLLARSGHPDDLSGHTDLPRMQSTTDAPAGPDAEEDNT